MHGAKGKLATKVHAIKLVFKKGKTPKQEAITMNKETRVMFPTLINY
jgi:hypothetical protein